MMKKVSKFIVVVLIVFLVGGIGGVFFDRYVFPSMSSSSLFANFDFFKKANENVTIINKTEQIVVRDDKPINEIASGAASSVVTVLSVQDKSVYSSVINSKRGSGVVITSDGVVMTYGDLVFEGDAKYYVYSRDGQEHEASVIGVDSYSNLVFLKVDDLGLPAISFANPDDLVVGQKLIAIGSFAYAHQNIFTVGHFEGVNRVSNLSGKTLSYSDRLEGLLETDIVDLSEYIGGPVVNYSGELVGVTGVNEFDEDRYYFQIPADVIKKSINLLIDGELNQRASLGVYYVPLTKINAKVIGVELESGAYVYSASGKQGLAVVYNMPGQKAGIKIGDVIVSVGGSEVNVENPLPEHLSGYKSGDKVEMIVNRKGEEMSLEVIF
ncbi:S1C family serine protease [Patescibacteria group bacterium]